MTFNSNVFKKNFGAPTVRRNFNCNRSVNLKYQFNLQLIFFR